MCVYVCVCVCVRVWECIYIYIYIYRAAFKTYTYIIVVKHCKRNIINDNKHTYVDIGLFFHKKSQKDN